MTFIIGYSALDGAPASLSVATPKKFIGGTYHQKTLPANQKLVSVHLGWGTGIVTTGSGSIKVGLYNQSDASTNKPLVSGSEQTISYNNAAINGNGSGTQWVSVTGLNIDFSSHAGKSLATAASTNTGAAFPVVVQSAAGTGAGTTRQNHTSTSTTMPSTFVPDGSDNANRSWSIYFQFEDLAPSVTIDTINGTAYGAVKAGSSGNTVTTTSSFTPTSGTHGGKAISAIAGSAGSYTFTSAAYVDGATFPQPDTSQTFSLTDGTSSPTASSVFSSPDGMTSVVIASPITADSTYIGSAYTLANNDRWVYPTLGGDFFVDADGKINALNAGTYVCWHWRVSDSVMTQVTLNISESGAIVSVGLTSSTYKVTARRI